jgi:hypothetical protein
MAAIMASVGPAKADVVSDGNSSDFRYQDFVVVYGDHWSAATGGMMAVGSMISDGVSFSIGDTYTEAVTQASVNEP